MRSLWLNQVSCRPIGAGSLIAVVCIQKAQHD
jgi:hypothetical protein